MGQIAVQKAIALARTQLGVPYVFGGTEWNVGMDCSGFMMELWQRVGVQLERTSQEQWAQQAGGSALPNIQPGDIIFFQGSDFPPPDHEGMCITFDFATGNGTFINEPFTGAVCRIDQFNIHETGTLALVGATRPANLLPDPVPPPPPPPVPKEHDMIIAICPTITGDWLCIGSRRCHLDPAQLTLVKSLYNPPVKTLTAAQLIALTVVPWGSI